MKKTIRQCATSFVFRSDVEDHKENEGHSKISKHDLSSYMNMGVDIGDLNLRPLYETIDDAYMDRTLVF
jgi:hypothetical protein